MDVITAQFISLSIHNSDNQETIHGGQLTEQQKAYILKLQSHLTKEHLLAHEPWSGHRIPPEYIQSRFSDPPVMFFGIGVQLTTEDLLPIARTLNAPISICSSGDKLIQLLSLVRDIRRTIRKGLTSHRRIESWEIMSPSTNMTVVICITDNSLDRLSHKPLDVDDETRLRTIKWEKLQISAEALHNLTGREPKWYIGGIGHNIEWDCRTGHHLFGLKMC
ncbi:uncharacterized protein EI90DRAFT_2996134 [Cantharellus anzutake]|uniref:uncharacterized protein n=1 Tax=Cantharellus anzutake TaxID=1750568 RepID=UPI001907485F|nr:uncharacterized protein EI90DRAFT_2996134 [Cantharellus anzutake]KAF8331017.1 hypothetical protein EI90DRAFT_2996134 [Cantharellus anzutake]